MDVFVFVYECQNFQELLQQSFHLYGRKSAVHTTAKGGIVDGETSSRTTRKAERLSRHAVLGDRVSEKERHTFEHGRANQTHAHFSQQRAFQHLLFDMIIERAIQTRSGVVKHDASELRM